MSPTKEIDSSFLTNEKKVQNSDNLSDKDKENRDFSSSFPIKSHYFF